MITLYSLIFVVLGYLSGSVLYSRVYISLSHSKSFYKKAADKNPGAANAFKYGGFTAGVFTVIGDIAKGIIPVALYMRLIPDAEQGYWLSLVLASPVVGHLFPLFYDFQGGKGIAVSFGALLGLVPIWQPVLTLAALFLFFVLVIPVSPDYFKTILVYGLFAGCALFFNQSIEIKMGCILMSAAIEYKMVFLEPHTGKLKGGFLWKR